MVKGIYKLTNDRTGEVYIGQAQNLDSRLNRHLRELAQGKHHNNGMQRDYNRGDTFSFEVLEKLPNSTKADLYNSEAQYISKFNSFKEGYNQTPGGVMDQFKGKYEYGGGRLPPEKYQPTKKYLTKVLGDCPNCGGYLIRKTGINGEFVGCDNFPDCRFSCSLNEFESLSTAPSFKPSITISQSKIINSEFEKFCTKKNNYLTRSDCDYLAEKYDIDISTVSTVKKANPIIRNYLNRTNQWKTAMEDLYNHKSSLKQTTKSKKESVPKSQLTKGEIISGHCPECGGKLIKVMKDLIECEKYPMCSFHCSNNYYVENHLSLISKPKETLSSQIQDSETINEIKDKAVANEESISEDVDYCNFCGGEIFGEDEYCINCGQKINVATVDLELLETTSAIIEEKGLATRGSVWDDVKEIISSIIVPLIIFSSFGSPFLNMLFNYTLSPIFFVLAIISTIACIGLCIYGVKYEKEDVGGIIATIILGVWNLVLVFVWFLWLPY
ncbi:topoisomerase DNA-binding C4 zinc finger domain-containing protein [Methanobrevibacter sp.]|uniref:topoisomerase DNA-binding C4 zinc finger domain-containing protein n=1 Tax=Methanobrevibacter sp. TaxID=66852 RepID=UPI00386E03DA